MGVDAPCSEDGCPNVEQLRRGRCNRHYRQWLKAASPEERRRPTEQERFWSYVDKAGPLPKWAPFLGPCWIWTGCRHASGYGMLNVGGRKGRLVRAHRYSYELLVGPIPDGLQLDHLCRVPACVNPDHLEPVTNRENTMRGSNFTAEKARQTHCIRGHEFDAENTYVRPNGTRLCRACGRAASAAYREKRRRTVRST